MKNRETEKNTKRNASPQGDPKIPEGGRFVNPKYTILKTGLGNCTKKERGTKVAKYSNLSTTGSRRSILGRALRAGKHMCHPCKMSDHNVEGHSVGMENQRRFLSREH